MRIFVGYHFDPRDQWVEDLVYPLIRAFGDEVVTGENLYGEGALGEAVTNKIKKCDALLGFATQRNKIQDNLYTTHPWVTGEIAQGLALKLKVVEVRETGVDPERGIAGECQYIPYNEKERDRCLVQLAEALGGWHRHRIIRLQILPEEVAREIAMLLKDSRFRCTYQLLEDEEGTEPSLEQSLKLVEFTGGLFANIRNVPSAAFIQVRIECGAKSWTSVFESTSYYGIRMKETRS